MLIPSTLELRWSCTLPNHPSQVGSASGDFYLQDGCCTSCGVPQAIAPELVGWKDENSGGCYWIKQPETLDEMDRAIRILHTQELGCHRYSGKEPAILYKLPPEDCDILRPDMALNHWPTLGASDVPLKFSLSVSENEHGLLRKLWRKLTRTTSSS
jgi:hypothetical protein